MKKTSTLKDAINIARGGNPPEGKVLLSGKGRPPRGVRHCWECGRRLSFNKDFAVKVIDGHSRVLHKACAKAGRDWQEKGV